MKSSVQILVNVLRTSPPTLPSPRFPGALHVGRSQVRGSAGKGKREGASGPPSVSLACFNRGPMRAPTKEPGWNHRLLLCCTGSQRGCEGPRRFAGCSRRHSRPPALFALEIVLSQVTVKGACSRHDILHCHRSPPPPPPPPSSSPAPVRQGLEGVHKHTSFSSSHAAGR